MLSKEIRGFFSLSMEIMLTFLKSIICHTQTMTWGGGGIVEKICHTTFAVFCHDSCVVMKKEQHYPLALISVCLFGFWFWFWMSEKTRSIFNRIIKWN